MPVLLKVGNIGAFKHKLKKFAFIIFYILGSSHNKTEVYVGIKCELYLVKGVKANILIGNNIFCIKDFSINLLNVFVYI